MVEGLNIPQIFACISVALGLHTDQIWELLDDFERKGSRKQTSKPRKAQIKTILIFTFHIFSSFLLQDNWNGYRTMETYPSNTPSPAIRFCDCIFPGVACMRFGFLPYSLTLCFNGLELSCLCSIAPL